MVRSDFTDSTGPAAAAVEAAKSAELVLHAIKRERKGIKEGATATETAAIAAVPSVTSVLPPAAHAAASFQDTKSPSAAAAAETNEKYKRPCTTPSAGVRTTFNAALQHAVYPHILSFDTLVQHFIPQVVKHLPVLYVHPHGSNELNDLNPYLVPTDFLKLAVESVKVCTPTRWTHATAAGAFNPSPSSSAGGAVLYEKKQSEAATWGAAEMKGLEITAADRERLEQQQLLLLPRHCRETHTSYEAPLEISFLRSSCRRGENNQQVIKKTVRLGGFPIMLRSCVCSTRGMSPKELQIAGEEENDGGYFIINGNEKVIRFVLQQRTNYPLALERESLKNKEVFATNFGISLRSQRLDGTCTTNILLDTEDGRCCYRVLLNKREYFCPFFLLLRCLGGNLSASQLKSKFLEGSYNDPYECSQKNFLLEENLLRETLFSHSDLQENRPLNQLGRLFYKAVSWMLRPGSTYEDAARRVIETAVLPHLDSWSSKFDMLLMMHRKLLAMKAGKIPPDNIDSFAFQELILPGQILAAVLKDALLSCLVRIRLNYMLEMRMLKNNGVEDLSPALHSDALFDIITDRCTPEISQKLTYFMATGNIRTTQLDLQQLAGWTVTADRLNLHRFLSHFRAVHRGQFFTTMKTTSVRKLLGEMWGFLCPVHTPDGAPCGLLLHLTQSAEPVALPSSRKAAAAVRLFLHRIGVAVDIEGISGLPSVDLALSASANFSVPLGYFSADTHQAHSVGAPRKKEKAQNESKAVVAETVRAESVNIAAARKAVEAQWTDQQNKTLKKQGFFPLIVDGEIVASLPTSHFIWWRSLLLSLKRSEQQGFHRHWELAAFSPDSGQFEGIFIFSYPGRLVRAVRHVDSNRVDYVGPLMQPWADIACTPADVRRSYRLLKLQEPAIEATTDKSVKVESLAAVYKGLKMDLKTSSSEQASDEADENPLFAYSAPVPYEFVELKSTAFLSIAASLTPYSNHNQSPRNIYQCQMLKQTTGTPFLNIPYRFDNKAYRLITPQKPLVRTRDYRLYDFDDYPTGLNAVVAVLCYTCFDMEDAMILNKASVERGAFHSCVYKTKVLDAAPQTTSQDTASQYVFGNINAFGRKHDALLESDGFLPIGGRVRKGRVYARVQKTGGGAASAIEHEYKEGERGFVDGIVLAGGAADRQRTPMASSASGQLKSCRASVRLRCPRRPIVGDKFASRHGQKGILSLLWPPEDMPFSESGIVPDILFNPHGFPSRMTVGMLIEGMAGKAGAIHGAYQDATPFRKYPQQTPTKTNKWLDQGGFHGWEKRGGRYRTKSEEEVHAKTGNETPVDFFGKALLRSGYQYYGTEELYSGVYGVPMTAHIFTGLIYYQRLRHMVADKAQVRATGPVDALTHQPVKGRKRHGGVRFGEMERDALISHGASFLLQDRLLHCSDAHKAFCCPSCGNILSAHLPFVESSAAAALKGVQSSSISILSTAKPVTKQNSDSSNNSSSSGGNAAATTAATTTTTTTAFSSTAKLSTTTTTTPSSSTTVLIATEATAISDPNNNISSSGGGGMSLTTNSGSSSGGANGGGFSGSSSRSGADGDASFSSNNSHAGGGSSSSNIGGGGKKSNIGGGDDDDWVSMKRSAGGKRAVPLCSFCRVPCRLILIPYVFRYLVNELATMNIAIRLRLSELGKPLVVLPEKGSPADAVLHASAAAVDTV